MYVDDFEAFYLAAIDLYKARPLETRYTIKFRQGKVVLKVTDDRTCLKFKTDQQTDLRQIERITAIFFPLMACGELPAEGEQ
ncbi:Signal recognition particle protein [Tetrabaena socialis]|uniref:Signal recognition particle 9 kDa protein n=1 Tax=Tetrabaena socialis TaxID=47790 RepID=A0A2J7ZP33_9CHLO|nr:Signal recognition particle protein [Tetrabaena socialis]|eukprot:PNH02033.1 Signal recognition particle protein [Tetrabaena socialis]